MKQRHPETPTPFHDPGPCDHNLGVCEALASKLLLSSEIGDLLPEPGAVDEITSDPREAVPAATPPFLLP